MHKDRPPTPEDHVQVDWGGYFAASYHAAFPDQPKAVVSISYGPLALEYILATGGSGHFRKGFVRSYLEEGRIVLEPDSTEFSYSAYGRSEESRVGKEGDTTWRSRGSQCHSKKKNTIPQ